MFPLTGKPGPNRRTCGKTVVGNIPKPVKLSHRQRSSRRTALDAVWERYIIPNPPKPEKTPNSLNAESFIHR